MRSTSGSCPLSVPCRSARVALGALVLLAGLANVPAAPVLKVARTETGTPLLINGGFEDISEGKARAWAAAPNGFALAQREGRKASSALRVANTTAGRWVGASQTLFLNRTNTAPVAVRGWAKAENVSGSPDTGFSIYVDITYADGTPLWGQTGNFRTGTHDWQEREFLIFPEKPIKSLTLHCMLRGHSGVAWFDDISVTEITAGAGAVIFQGVPVTVATELERRRPVPPTAAKSDLTGAFGTADGFDFRLQDGEVSSLKIEGREVAGDAPSGFLARDVATGSDFFSFSAGSCPELGLRVHATFKAQADHVRLKGRISDTSGRDRAITLVFALPLDAIGWRWGEDIRRNHLIRTGSELANTVALGSGSIGTLSLYPLAAIWNENTGVGMGIDMAYPAQYRLAYHPGTKQLLVAYDFGLVPETMHFPGAADFSIVLFHFEPQWGFRAAFEKYTRIFPEYFQVRSKEQGIWMPFTDISTVQGWEDFGFKYHEGNNNVGWDDAHGIVSFRYTEPMTWWMRMAKDVPRTISDALQVRARLARGPEAHQSRMAQVSELAAMWDDSRQPALSFRDTPWCNGAVWSLNPNPALPVPADGFNAATVYWNPSVQDSLYGKNVTAILDGEYLDSLEGYVTVDLNFRREHFRHTTVPLTFASDTKQPALHKALAVFEFTRWFSGQVHGLGKLTFANGVPYRLTFLCPWLDVLGTETDWLRNGKFSPSADAQMSLWRTMSGAKPYLLLMNTDYDTFKPDLVEKYFRRSLFYGMFPSMFSHNAAENPYWRNPGWYNRDRELFKKYIPIIRRIAEAGWQPVTGATSTNVHLYLERFGAPLGRTNYLTVFNDTDQQQSGRIELDLRTLGGRRVAQIREMLSGQTLSAKADIEISLQPQQVAAFELQF